MAEISTKKYESKLTIIHHDKADLKLALEYTQKTTGFSMVLIEKDFYCSLLLEYFFNENDISLVFKGGTCLNKVYLGFYRLSEDLDFSIPVEIKSSRSLKSAKIDPIKEMFLKLPKTLPYFDVIKPLRGANNSTQYLAELAYQSVTSQETGRIKIEIGLREPLLKPFINASGYTLLLNPFTLKNAVLPVQINCLSKEEALAEKCRAALCRIEPAIRDFFDVWYAYHQNLLPLSDQNFLDLVKRKIAIPGNAVSEITGARIEDLKRQVTTELRPVLLPRIFESYDFNSSLELVKQLREMIRV